MEQIISLVVKRRQANVGCRSVTDPIEGLRTLYLLVEMDKGLVKAIRVYIEGEKHKILETNICKMREHMRRVTAEDVPHAVLNKAFGGGDRAKARSMVDNGVVPGLMLS